MCSKVIARLLDCKSNIYSYINECNFIGNLHNNCSILRPNIAEIIPNNHDLILTMVITCMSKWKSLGLPTSYMYQPLAVCCGSHHNCCAIVDCAGNE